MLARAASLTSRQNVTSSSTVVASLEGARDSKSPVILQVSQGGAAFFAGKGVGNKNQEASIAGAVAAAHYVRAIAPTYGVPVIMHSDHCAKKLLPWFDGMLEADEAYFKEHKEPLFSSHMLDLSEETKEENIETCVKYLKRMAKIDLWLEMEVRRAAQPGKGADDRRLASLVAREVHDGRLTSLTMRRRMASTTPALTMPPSTRSPRTSCGAEPNCSEAELRQWDIYKAFSAVTPMFSIAAAFGNVRALRQTLHAR